jgi:hypothetical protein
MAKMFALNLAIMVSFGKRILLGTAGNGNMSVIHSGKSVQAGGGVGCKRDFKRIQG